MRVAIVLGRGAAVWEEMEAAKQLLGSHPRTIVATKRAGRDYDGPVHEWPSFHPEMFAGWIAERAKHNRPPAQRLWSARSPKVKSPSNYGLAINWLESIGGSSGLLAIQVGFAIGRPPYDNEPLIDKMILCGIPMEESVRYDDGKIWKEALFYRDHWIKYFRDDPRRRDHVRSMSGWTQELLGAPTEEWLRGD